VGVALIAGLALGTYYYYAHWRQTPRYALWQMVRALQANDTQTLFQYVDLQSITENLMNESAGDFNSWLLNKGLGGIPGDDDISRLARNLTKKFARFLTPKFVAALEPQFRAMAEKYLAELTTLERASLSALPTQAEIHQRDDMASVKFVDPQSGQTFRFSMARPPEGGTWRIVEIDYQDLKSLVERRVKD